MTFVNKSIIVGMLAAVLLFAPALLQAGIAPRTVLVETFTNVSCAGCSDANAVTKQYMDDHGRHEVVNLQYHLNWPHPADPYHLVDSASNTGRTMYYMIGSAPSLKTDGDATVTANYALLDAHVQTRRATTSPLRLDVAQQRNGLDLNIEVDVSAVGAISGDLVLRVAVVEEADHLSPPPGSNGETDFYWTMRSMLPDHAGSAVSVTEGGSQSFSFSTTLDAAWADTDLFVIAWVQNEDDRDVVQSATTAPRADYAVDFYAERFGSVLPVGILSHISSFIENTGTQADTYDVHLAETMPGDWGVAACAGPICYPPWIRDFSVTLQPGEIIDIVLDVTAGVGPSSAVFDLTVTSQASGAVTTSLSFTALAPGADVLFVDADGGFAYETYFTDALTATGTSWSIWDRNAFGAITPDEMALFPAVFWNAELSLPAITADDRATLAVYLAQQGSLLLSGQDIAFDLADPASPNHTPDTQQWYEDHTGAAFGADDSQDIGLLGVAGDPIGGGLIFNIAGGSGANNQGYPDVLIPAANARAVMEYSPGNAAAVRYLLNGAHVVTLGFGFEGIDTVEHRTAFLQRVLDWFAVTDPTAVEDPPEAAVLVGDATACPNPFNPSTRLIFSIAGQGRVDVIVDLFDLRGQRVRRLLDGPLGEGRHALSWDGRHDHGGQAASGTYLARVLVGDAAQTLKLVLSR